MLKTSKKIAVYTNDLEHVCPCWSLNLTGKYLFTFNNYHFKTIAMNVISSDIIANFEQVGVHLRHISENCFRWHLLVQSQ